MTMVRPEISAIANGTAKRRRITAQTCIAAAAILGLSFEARADASKSYAGHVLPFEIITAIRNYGFAEGMRPAQVAVSVHGGSQADWLATAAFVAEKSIVPDVTFSEVEIYVASPWGDLPPTRAKQLAKAYYGGPDPTKSPWPDDPFAIFAQGHAPTLADIEFDELSGKILDDSDAAADPDKASDAADAKAGIMIRRKYHLPTSWKPDESLGPMDTQAVNVKGSQVVISDATAADASLAALTACLTKTDSANLFRGCPDRSQKYAFHPYP